MQQRTYIIGMFAKEIRLGTPKSTCDLILELVQSFGHDEFLWIEARADADL